MRVCYGSVRYQLSAKRRSRLPHAHVGLAGGASAGAKAGLTCRRPHSWQRSGGGGASGGGALVRHTSTCFSAYATVSSTHSRCVHATPHASRPACLEAPLRVQQTRRTLL